MSISKHAPVVSASAQAGPGLIVNYMSGWSMQETAGAVAQVRLRDGTVIGDPIIVNVKLAASQALGQDYSNPIGLAKTGGGGGVYVELVAGAVDVTIYGG